MTDHTQDSDVARRSFLSRLGAGIALTGLPVAAVSAQAPSAWKPARHAADDWFDAVPGQHRLVFDTITPEGIGQALGYASNFLLANQTGYGLTDADLAVVIVARHHSTPFAFADAMWKKYGTPIGNGTDFDDPKTKQRPVVNVYNAEDYPMLPSRGATMTGLAKRGVHFAVCQMATRRYAGQIATATGAKADDVYQELAANLVPNSHIVPAGIVAVSRAQERGYTLAVTT